MELTKGQKIKIDNNVDLKFDSFYDVSCFCLNKDGKLIDDNHMIFYNQLNTPDNSIVFTKNEQTQSFSIDFSKISSVIDKMSFVITADDQELKNLSKPFTCVNKDFTFTLDSKELLAEKALMFCEVYIKDGQWRFNAYAQGFNGGLETVLANYGGSESQSQPDVKISAIESPILNNNVVASKPISLTKISLNKQSKPAVISLAKDSAENSSIEISTKWYDNGDGDSDNDDLDLRVGLLLPDGRMTLIHAGELGSLTNKPYVAHSGDVQVVQNSEGVETVKVNPKISHLLGGKVAMVFSVYSAVDNGDVAVASLRPIMEIKTKDHLIECEFNSAADFDSGVYTYVIGLIVIDGDQLTVKQLGLTAEPGSEETPWLTWDKNNVEPIVEIKGPEHFKGQKISKNVASTGFFGKKVNYRYCEYVDI